MSPAGPTSTKPSVVMATARTTGPHLTVAGDVDAAGAARLRAQLDDAFSPGAQLTMDLSRVTHLGAEALSVLVHGYRRLRDSGGTLVLADVPPPVVRVLRVSGLDRVLTVQHRVVVLPATDPRAAAQS